MGNSKKAVEAQIEKLQSNGSVAKAKAWWNGLSPAKKAIAIGIFVGLGWGSLAYWCTVGKASVVVKAGGVITPGPAITSAQAFWNAVVAGSLAGGLAGYVSYNYYQPSDVVVEDESHLSAV